MKLETVHGEEVATGAEAQFLDEAAELLPLVVEKVNAVARYVHFRKNCKCESRQSVPEMDQIGRFAEGRSDRIMELPKDDAIIH